ncbi:hypothetical protein OV203_16740 [Nannocystis sp. ILAH1]|uniref:hypothetical protein n=1 Tax=Nannocystis sp. ILAH1 TaxID=2996789 RepID=UPI00226F735A|nr:hypothetical protein [Nannocystis sp. ILAH1]MCY0988785.1 hypothetical protein [Nannocystis sp. ILAH1]
MESSAYRSLAFLFSLGTLPIACGPKGGDTTDGSTGGTDPTRGTTDGTPATPTDGMSSGPATAGATDSAGTTDPGGTTGTGGPCQAYVDYFLRCDPEDADLADQFYAQCMTFRHQAEVLYGPTCLALHDAVYECMETAECQDGPVCGAETEVADACLPEAGASCIAFSAKEAECYGEPVPANAAGHCQLYVNSQVYYGGPACGAAVEEYFACLADLPCPEFEMGSGCDVQEAELVTACGGGP